MCCNSSARAEGLGAPPFIHSSCGLAAQTREGKTDKARFLCQPHDRLHAGRFFRYPTHFTGLELFPVGCQWRRGRTKPKPLDTSRNIMSATTPKIPTKMKILKICMVCRTMTVSKTHVMKSTMFKTWGFPWPQKLNRHRANQDGLAEARLASACESHRITSNGPQPSARILTRAVRLARPQRRLQIEGLLCKAHLLLLGHAPLL